MPGIVDLPVRVCPKCLTVYMEDDHMYVEPDRCPKCGYQPGSDAGPETIEYVG